MNKKPVNSNPTKEFFSLLKTIEKNTKNQARISSYNAEDISSFMVEICPIKGVYQHAKFIFQIQLMLYPREFPNVICISDIYHPNIETGEDYHNVCLNLFDNWNRSFGLIDVIQGLIFLLYQPNLSDPISSFFNSKNTNEEIFRKNVYTSLHGGIIDGIEFLPNPGIIEYNETVKKKALTEQKVVIVEQENVELFKEVESIVISDDKQESHDSNNDVEITNTTRNNDSNNDVELTNTMRNNNAAQIESLAELVEIIQTEMEEEPEEPLPTRNIVSPNAFYSDLICSRYAQPDKLSESDADSEICNAFDCYYDDTDGEEDNEDDDDDDIQFIRDDDYITLPSNSLDPSNVFLSKWLELRMKNNMNKECPAPMTSIILTNVLNPFRNIIGTFFLCDVQNFNNWRTSDQSVYMMKRSDWSLHSMVWLQNICRWSMRRSLAVGSSSNDRDSGSGAQLLWYCLYLGLCNSIYSRLTHSYNYGNSDHHCLYID